jgi:hypothetical protein
MLIIYIVSLLNLEFKFIISSSYVLFIYELTNR